MHPVIPVSMLCEEAKKYGVVLLPGQQGSIGAIQCQDCLAFAGFFFLFPLSFFPSLSFVLFFLNGLYFLQGCPPKMWYGIAKPDGLEIAECLTCSGHSGKPPSCLELQGAALPLNGPGRKAVYLSSLHS